MVDINIILYKITNLTNDRYYIGSTKNEDKRFKNHMGVYENAKSQNNELHKEIEELGVENFKIEILYSGSDNVEVSRMESKLIRQNKGDEKMYNKTLGAAGRRVFYESDIVFIRELYDKKELYITEAYDMYYKDVVSFRAFKKIWHGDTFKDIHYDVYNKENKLWHFAKGQSRPAENNGRSKLTKEDVINIRRRRDNNEESKHVFEDYRNLVSHSVFRKVWKDKSWTSIIH